MRDIIILSLRDISSKYKNNIKYFYLLLLTSFYSYYYPIYLRKSSRVYY